MIKRANDTVSYSVNIPLALIGDLCWNKGDVVSFRILDDKLLIFKEENKDGRD